jgi:tetratricopeptide (TPR) repeat protein
VTDGKRSTLGNAVTGASSPADSGLAPGSKFGRYVILDHIGAGGMGVVMSAYDPQLDRRVALKLLASSLIEEQARLRLLREAQAMAQLSHPNVVPVYDAGSVEDRVFITMEFVEGLTLRAWLDGESRPWTEVLQTMRSAGLGLQVAHEAGLVHRDFKPDNIMVGNDGRVRVLDFGLARGEAVDGELVKGETAERSPERAQGERALSTPLTTDGAFLGTPAYMPPEQLEGLPVDARADQWSFCATLYEALYGSRPFEAETVAASFLAMHNGDLRPAPRSSPVPDSVFAAIARGLELDPGARHPSMAALLDALELRATGRRGRLVVAGAGASAAIAGMLWWTVAAEPEDDPACASRASAASEVWSARTQQAGADAFASSTVGFRDEAWARSSDRIDAYVTAWNDEAGRACRASTPDTAEVDALRNRCLDDRLRRLRAVVDAFADANDDVVRGAIETVFDLPPVASCADTVGLLAAVRPPDDPATRAELERLEDDLENAAVQELSADYAKGRKLAQAVVDQARELGHDPFTAQALLAAATFDRKQGHSEAARDACIEAFELAAAARDDQGAAKIASDLVFVLGYELRSNDAAQAWTTVAATMVARAGQAQQATGASLHNALGNVAFAQGEYERARAEFAAALEIWEALPGDHPVRRATALSNLGAAYSTLGRTDDAYDHHRRALELREATFGPEHPDVAVSLGHLGTAELGRGNLESARELQERGLAIKRVTLPPDHPSIGASATNLGGLLLQMGDSEGGVAVLEDALELYLSNRPKHPTVADILSLLAQAYANLGRNDQSEAAFRRALELQRQLLGPEHPTVANTLGNLSELLRRVGRPEDALPLGEQSLAIRTAALGPDHSAVGQSWYVLSSVYGDLGRRTDALDAADKAQAIAEQHGRDEFQLARRRMDLAKLRWRLDEDRATARRVIANAVEVMAKSPERETELQADARAWLQAHPAPG